jgi:hypothetical protein
VNYDPRRSDLNIADRFDFSIPSRDIPATTGTEIVNVPQKTTPTSAKAYAVSAPISLMPGQGGGLPNGVRKAMSDAGYLASLIPEEWRRGSERRRHPQECHANGCYAAAHAQMYTMGALLTRQRRAKRKVPSQDRHGASLQAFASRSRLRAQTPSSNQGCRDGDHYVVWARWDFVRCTRMLLLLCRTRQWIRSQRQTACRCCWSI